MSPAFAVVAIISAYNEADIIDHVVGNLLAQGVDVYFLDDGSTDATVAIVEKYLGRGVLAVERLASPNPEAVGRGFAWERILLRKAQLARELDASWFLHHDADEFRESPWTGLPLVDAIGRVDALGYNAIDFACLDFWPTHDRFQPGDDVRLAFPGYAESAPYDRLQIRCWKKTADLDLASSGGHEARFPGRNVFPLRFVLRHYPIRGQAHGERKIFRERRNRFSARERALGWHVQYDDVHEGASFIRDPSTLTPYDPDAVRLALTLRHRGVEALEAALAATRADVDGLRDQLEAKTSALDARTRELTRCAGEFARAEVALGAAAAEAGALRRQIAERTGDVDAVTMELARCATEFSHAEAAIGAAAKEAAALRADLNQKTRDIRSLEDLLDGQTDDIARWRNAVEDLRRRLDAAEKSLSWRLTAPARAAFRLLIGR